MSGAGTLDIYDGSFLAASHGVVVVTVNYRLGPFGFMYAGIDGSPGNVGLLDQAMGLEWVSDNIANFGGNPERITVMGESAGGASVSFLLLSSLSNRYIKNAVIQSGAPSTPWAFQNAKEALKHTIRFAHHLDCGEGTMEEQVNCLRTKSADTIASAQYQFVTTYPDFLWFSTPFRPTLDGYLLSKEPYELIEELKGQSKTVLIGVNSDEGSYFLPYGYSTFHALDPNDITEDEYKIKLLHLTNFYSPTATAHHITDFLYTETGRALRGESYREVLGAIAGDLCVVCPVVEFIDHLRQAVPVYVYKFTHRTQDQPWPSWMGVMHGYEIDYVFGIPLNGSLSGQTVYTEDEKELSKTIMDLWVSLAKNGYAFIYIDRGGTTGQLTLNPLSPCSAPPGRELSGA